MTMVDIWIRRRKQQGLTKNGFHWKHVDLMQSIIRDSKSIELDVVSVKSDNSRYIVALLEDENEKEIPVRLSEFQAFVS
jgi:hypothetical protein